MRYLEYGAHGLGLQLTRSEEQLQVLVQKDLNTNIRYSSKQLTRGEEQLQVLVEQDLMHKHGI